MKKALLLAAAAGSLAVSAAPPPEPVQQGTGYPACSRSVRDRCIQLNERGVASQENLAFNRGGEPDQEAYAASPAGDMPPYGTRHAMMPPAPGGMPEADSVVAAPPPGGMQMAMNDYPPCSEAVQDRCVQSGMVVRREYLTRIGERG